jgi:hypothetical protein
METNKKGLITGKEGGPITLEVAASWTKNYRDKHPGENISQLFGKEILESVLAQDGCQGIRFYYAKDHDGKRHLIIVGVNSDGTDQLEHKQLATADMAVTAAVGAGEVPLVGDQSMPCPGSVGCPKNALTGGN